MLTIAKPVELESKVTICKVIVESVSAKLFSCMVKDAEIGGGGGSQPPFLLMPLY